MIIKIFLWATLLLYAFHFSGHLHNIVANVPNWSSGEIEDMKRYANFYHKGKNTYFFAPVIFASIFTTLVSLILVWNSGGMIRILILADFLIVVAVLISVFTLFQPINQYFESNQYDVAILKSMVDKWLLYNQIRLAIISVGLILSIWAIQVHK